MLNRSVFLRQSLLASSLICVSASAVAESSTSTDLDPVVVTATRTAQTQDQTLAPVTVIDRAQIDRLQPSSIAELLRGTPDLQIANNGGPGKATTLFLRGTESDHVLVLVDGLKIGSATAGLASIQDIPVDDIQRIEIVRGPFSSLYGSEALGGVIQIFTRHGQGAFNPNASLGVGSYRHLDATAGFSGRSGAGWYALQASHENTDGINSCRIGAAEAFAGCFADQPDRDGYRNNALTLRGGYKFSDAWDGDAQFLRTQGHNQYDGSTSDSADTVTQVAGGNLRYQPSKNVDVKLNLGQTADRSTDYLQGNYADRFDTRRDLGSLQTDIGAGGGLYTVGFDFQRDQVTSSADFALDHRVNRGLFGQWQQTFGAQSLQASARRDDNSQFGGKNTGSVLYGYDLSKTLRVTASYGTAYKAPTFNELYYPDYGNPNLAPETAQNIELGLRSTPGWGTWSISAFRNNVNHLISYDGTLTNAQHPFGQPNNIDRARIRGAEGSISGTLASWALRANATWLDPRSESGGTQGNLLPRRARRFGSLDADHTVGAFSTGVTWFISSARYDDVGNTHRLGGYALTDLRFGYTFAPDWKLQLALKNVFDKDYETARYYNQPGRNFMLTLKWQPAS